MDLLYRLLGIHRSPPPELAEADRVTAKVDAVVKAHRDKVAEAFRETQAAMKGNGRRVP